jgi:hypothetical protein
MTVVEWDFLLLRHSYGDIVWATFLNNRNQPVRIHLDGFRIISHPKLEDGRRCVCLEFFESGFKNMFPDTAALTLIYHCGNEIVAHDEGKVYWALQRGESVTAAAMRIAKVLDSILRFSTKEDQWMTLGLISWFSVLQHTMVWNGTAWISEAEFLRQGHNFPCITDRRFFSGALLLSVTTRE